MTLQLASCANHLEHEAALRDYTSTYLQPLLKSIVEVCLTHQPEKPADFLRQWFNNGCPKLPLAYKFPESGVEGSGRSCTSEFTSSRLSATLAGAGLGSVEPQQCAAVFENTASISSNVIHLADQLDLRVRDLRRASLACDAHSLPAVEADSGLHSGGVVADAIAHGFLWRDDEVLRSVFSRHASASGTMHSEVLPQAARDAFRLFNSELKSSSAFDAPSAHSDCLKFEDFRDLIICSSAVEGHIKQSAVSRVLADAICARCGSEKDSLRTFAQLSQESMVDAIAAAAPGVLLALREVQAGLSREITRNSRARSTASSGKFHSDKMSCGTVADFHQGLTARIGTSTCSILNQLQLVFDERDSQPRVSKSRL